MSALKFFAGVSLRGGHIGPPLQGSIQREDFQLVTLVDLGAFEGLWDFRHDLNLARHEQLLDDLGKAVLHMHLTS